MPFFKSMPDDAGPANVFTAYPDIYGPWADTGQALMNGPSPFTPGEREMIAAFVVGVAECKFAYVAHSAAAYAWGIEDGLVDKLLNDLDSAPIEDKFKPLLRYVRTLTASPNDLTQADADAVFDAGWDEKGLHDAIAVTARMLFMSRIVLGHGFTPMSKAKARLNAKKRVEKGYRNLYPEFAKK
jgi:hypothetical protein